MTYWVCARRGFQLSPMRMSGDCVYVRSMYMSETRWAREQVWISGLGWRCWHQFCTVKKRAVAESSTRLPFDRLGCCHCCCVWLGVKLVGGCQWFYFTEYCMSTRWINYEVLYGVWFGSVGAWLWLDWREERRWGNEDLDLCCVVRACYTEHHTEYCRITYRQDQGYVCGCGWECFLDRRKLAVQIYLYSM